MICPVLWSPYSFFNLTLLSKKILVLQNAYILHNNLLCFISIDYLLIVKRWKIMRSVNVMRLMRNVFTIGIFLFLKCIIWSILLDHKVPLVIVLYTSITLSIFRKKRQTILNQSYFATVISITFSTYFKTGCNLTVKTYKFKICKT